MLICWCDWFVFDLVVICLMFLVVSVVCKARVLLVSTKCEIKSEHQARGQIRAPLKKQLRAIANSGVCFHVVTHDLQRIEPQWKETITKW